MYCESHSKAGGVLCPLLLVLLQLCEALLQAADPLLLVIEHQDEAGVQLSFQHLLTLSIMLQSPGDNSTHTHTHQTLTIPLPPP